MRNYKLYVHISPDNKKYYGITCQEPKRRWQNGKGYGYNKYFTRAINKYGWDNFEHIILLSELTKEEAELKEQEYIALYNTTNPKFGYNLTKGGEGTLGWKPNEAWRKKQSENNSGQGNPMYGKHHSEETKSKISEKKTNLSEETRELMRKNHTDFKGKKHPKATIYEVIDNNGDFVGYFCGNELYNKDGSNGMLGISKGVFNRHIKPYGNIDTTRTLMSLTSQNQHTKNMIEKLKPFDKWTIKEVVPCLKTNSQYS